MIFLNLNPHSCFYNYFFLNDKYFVVLSALLAHILNICNENTLETLGSILKIKKFSLTAQVFFSKLT